jgi:hypothetical protein
MLGTLQNDVGESSMVMPLMVVLVHFVLQLARNILQMQQTGRHDVIDQNLREQGEEIQMRDVVTL